MCKLFFQILATAREPFLAPSLRAPMAVSLGAIAGALCRYYLTIWITQRLGLGFPYATLGINLSGCFGLGLFTTLVLEQGLRVAPELRLLVTVGFLGAYTTFSTYELESIRLMQAQAIDKVVMYWAGSALLGALSTYGGILTARLF